MVHGGTARVLRPADEPPGDTISNEKPALPKPYSGGTCPTLKGGQITFKSNGSDREIHLFIPPKPTNSSVLFIWHGLGDNPTNMGNVFGAQGLAIGSNTIAVIPKGANGPPKPPTVSDALFGMLKQYMPQMFETWSFFGDPKPDLTLFDDMVACLDKQYDINNTKVYTTGFSAGALWSTYLTMHRSEYLAASVLFSGGAIQKNFDLSTLPLGITGVVKVVDIPYATPVRRTPTLVAWGGQTDVFSMGGMLTIEFYKASQDLSAGLKNDKHTVIECNHNGGHTVPAGAISWGLDFLYKHAIDGKASPFNSTTLPGAYPQYCKAFPSK